MRRTSRLSTNLIKQWRQKKRSHVSDSPADRRKADNKPSPARKSGEQKGRYRRTSVQKNIDDKADVDEKEKYRSAFKKAGTMYVVAPCSATSPPPH